jgi:hypothetical protein
MEIRSLEESALAAVNYIKLHLKSLEEDSEKHQAYMNSITEYDSEEWEVATIEDISLNGQWIATDHLLSVVAGILINSNSERK